MISDNDDDDIFDYDHQFFDRSPFPDECQNEVQGIEAFNACFTRRYYACPVFYPGSLQEACKEAFSSIVIKERCPVLVYIHHDENFFSNVFCSNILCSEIIIEYLLNNYIVWPWDITFESNKTTLVEKWREIFSDQLLDIFSVERCPMLIGVMRRSAGEEGWSCISDYQFTILLKGDTLTCTPDKSTRETLLRELVIYKERCDDNEQALSFDFTAKTEFSWEIVLEIAKYLSLNDALKTFSDEILRLFHKHQTRLQISEPPEPFINMILRKLNPEQIVSLRLNAIRHCLDINLSSISAFTNVTSLSLLNPSTIDRINEYVVCFPKLTCLSLWYDGKINFDQSNNTLRQLCKPIKRFEIHCAGISCTHFYTDQLNQTYTQNLTVEYFLLDVGQFPLPSMNECRQHKKSCFLLTTIHFIKSLQSIRYVRLVTNKYNLDKALDWNEWKSLIDWCPQMKKVTVETLQTILTGEEFIQKAMEIKKVDRNKQ